jgi:glutaredoxin
VAFLVFLLTTLLFGTSATADLPATPPVQNSPAAEAEEIAVKQNIDATQLAQCLKSKGVIMYGASWCPHCQRQKALFGAGKEFVPYQECDANSPGGDMAKCQAAGVTAYPTWKFTSGETAVGEQSLSELAAKAQCL